MPIRRCRPSPSALQAALPRRHRFRGLAIRQVQCPWKTTCNPKLPATTHTAPAGSNVELSSASKLGTHRHTGRPVRKVAERPTDSSRNCREATFMLNGSGCNRISRHPAWQWECLDALRCQWIQADATDRSRPHQDFGIATHFVSPLLDHSPSPMRQ